MGIKGLFQFIRKKAPDVFEETHISIFAGKRVAVDTFLFLHSYKKSCEDDEWLKRLHDLAVCMRKYRVHPIFIFDTGAPQEKLDTQKKRAETRTKRGDESSTLLSDLKLYEEGGTITPKLMKYAADNKLISLLSQSIRVRDTRERLEQKQNQSRPITSEDVADIKEMLTYLGVPYYNAPLEAETTCADLCKRGLVDAVLTRDSDVVAYGAPYMIKELQVFTGNITLVNYSRILEIFDITKEQFLDFCIMCGTDYNDNIPKVGPVSAFKYIYEHKRLEDVPLDKDILNFVRVRELFTQYEELDQELGWCDMPNFQQLKTLFMKRGLWFSEDKLKSDLYGHIQL